MNQSCLRVGTCFAIQESEPIEKKRKFSNARQCLFIYNSFFTLESFLMLPCTIQIFPHDHTHQPYNSYQHNHTISPNIATPYRTFLWYCILPPPSHQMLTPLPHLRKSPFFSYTDFFHTPSASPPSIPKYLNIVSARYCIPLLGFKFSQNIPQSSCFPRVSFMEHLHHFQVIHKLCRFPGPQIIPSSPHKIL